MSHPTAGNRISWVRLLPSAGPPAAEVAASLPWVSQWSGLVPGSVSATSCGFRLAWVPPYCRSLSLPAEGEAWPFTSSPVYAQRGRQHPRETAAVARFQASRIGIQWSWPPTPPPLRLEKKPNNRGTQTISGKLLPVSHARADGDAQRVRPQWLCYGGASGAHPSGVSRLTEAQEERAGPEGP